MNPETDAHIVPAPSCEGEAREEVADVPVPSAPL